MADDPFDDVNDIDLQHAHIAHKEHMLKDDIIKHMSRGNYNLRWLQDRFSDEMFDKGHIEKLVREVADELAAEDGTTDLRMEVASFLATNRELKRTLFDMLDGELSGGKPRTVVEIAKTIAQLDKERIDFMKWAGLAHVPSKNADPSKLSANNFDLLESEADGHERRFQKTRQPRAIEGKVEVQ